MGHLTNFWTFANLRTKAKRLCTCCSSIQFSLRGAARHLIGSEESPDENRNSDSPLKLFAQIALSSPYMLSKLKKKLRLSSLFYNHILYFFTNFLKFFYSKDHWKHLDCTNFAWFSKPPFNLQTLKALILLLIQLSITFPKVWYKSSIISVKMAHWRWILIHTGSHIFWNSQLS